MLGLESTKSYTRANEITGDIVDNELPHNWIIDHLMVFKDLSVGCAFSIELPPYFTFDAEKKDDLHEVIAGFLNTLDERFEIQFLWNIERQGEDIYKAALQGEPQNQLMRIFKQDVADRIKERADKNLIRRYKSYVTLVRRPNVTNKVLWKRAKAQKKKLKAEGFKDEPQSIFSMLSEMFELTAPPPWSKKYKPSEWQEVKEDIFATAGSLKATLEQAGLVPEYLYEQDIVNVLYEWWNPNLVHSGVAVGDVPKEPFLISELIAQSRIQMNRKAGLMHMDGKVHRILTLRNPPSELVPNTFEYIINQNIIPNLRIINNFIPYSRDKRIQELQDKLPMLEARMEKDLKLAVVVEQLRDEVLRLQRGEESTWGVTTIFHIWGDNEAEVNQYATELQRMGKLCNKAGIVQEEHALWRYWLSAQPFWTRDEDLHRRHIYSASQGVCLIPFSGHPENIKGEKSAVMMESINSSIYNFNPMDYKRLSNYNTLILGSSGTGKSFLAGSLLMMMQRFNARVIGIDLGGSYQTLCEALNGNYITMNADARDQTINPLAIGDGEKVTALEREQITRFMEKALLDAGKTMSKKEASYIDEVLTQLFQSKEGKQAYLSDLRAQLQKYGKAETEILAEAMGMWCRGGKYGDLYDGPTQLDFDKPFSIFDMTAVKDNQDIAPLTIMAIMNNVRKMALSYPGDPKILLMDEAWFLLQDPVTMAFVAECFRTFRKLNVCIIGVSQGIEEWVGASASSILTNVSNFLILRQQSPKSAEAAGDILNLNPRETEIITQLKTVTGEYSEVFLFQRRAASTFSTIVLNRPTPLQYAIMTTRGIDKAAVEQIRAELGCSMLEARLEFAKRFPKGVTA